MTRNLFLVRLFICFIVPVRLSGQETISYVQSNQYYVKQDTSVPQISTRQKQVIESIEDYVQSEQSASSEKIFMHLDRTGYLPGDTIWFKAYSWYGYEQIPDTISSILYVDLLDHTGITKLSRKLLIQDGISEGDLCLDTTIRPGRYIIRAYTRWLQNLNTGEPFYQNITVNPVSQNFQVECSPVIIKHSGGDSLKVSIRFFELDPGGNLKDAYTHKINYHFRIGDQLLDSGQVLAVNAREQFFKSTLPGIDNKETKAVLELSIDDKNLSYKKQFEIPIREGIDIQFFPEGGTLVNGIQSRIAFKSIGTDGLSREVKGVIETEEGDTITEFASLHKGMGSFALKPESRKKYFAHFLFNNRNYVIPIPGASEEGCELGVNFTGNEGNPYFTIKCTPSEINTRKYVTGSANGKIWFSALVKLPKDSCHVKIPPDLLPEGICRLTLLSDDFKPECERLIYVDKNERFKIEIKPDSTSYGTRSKVTLMINAIGVDGAPVQTDLSLAVVDKELTTKDATINGICAYKLIESELQGNIEDAGSYFRDGNCIDHKLLDLLLLTQGYRKFLTNKSNPEEQKFLPETNFNVSGNVVLNGNKSRAEKFDYRNVNMTFMCLTGNFVNQSHPDSLGRFSLQIPLLYGKLKSILQATTLKGRKLYGEIFLDEAADSPKFTVPLTSDICIITPVIENIRRTQTIIKTTISKDPTAGNMTRNLPEIVVTAKAKNWYLNFEKDALKIVDLDSLDPDGKKYETLYDLLKREFGAREVHLRDPGGGTKTIFLPCSGYDCDYDYFPIYVTNGSTWFNAAPSSYEEYRANLSMVSNLNVNEIKKLMVLPPSTELSYYYADKELYMYIEQSLVVIETYKKGYRGDPQGIKTFIIEGLDAPRQFYSPRYDGPSNNSPVYDGRTTLLWVPSVRTDTNGQAKVDFYTSDRKTTLEVIVNGIETGNGAPGQGQIQINQASVNNP